MNTSTKLNPDTFYPNAETTARRSETRYRKPRPKTDKETFATGKLNRKRGLRLDDAPHGGRSFDSLEQTLGTYGEMVRARILRLLESGSPRGYLYEPASVYPRRASKSLRPALCIMTARAFGADLDAVLSTAVALELLHNAFLVHDDVEDGSLYRRGGPTLHSQYGIGIAVNTGDAMNVVGMRQLLKNRATLGSELAWRILAEFEHLARQSVEGQAMELGWVRDNRCDVSEADYLRMTLKKTCWYTAIHPCRIGALIALPAACDPDRFNRFGYYLGLAFQIQDDILNLVGDERRYGKEIDGDLLEGKRTLILIHLLKSCTVAERARIKRFLAAPRVERTAGDVSWIRELLAKYGSIEYTMSCAGDLARGAAREFSLAYAGAQDREARDFVERIVQYVVDRKY
jgi:geranylgeranyl diphosphate synthase, type II